MILETVTPEIRNQQLQQDQLFSSKVYNKKNHNKYKQTIIKNSQQNFRNKNFEVFKTIRYMLRR